jgi:hypothetical protein
LSKYGVAGASNVLWTGEGAQKIDDLHYPSRHGYRKMKPTAIGNFSHGILQISFERPIKHNQTGQVKIGIDAEQLRHFVQNKLMHDMIVLPKKWSNKNNAHLPMIDLLGNEYLFLQGQKIKKAKALFQMENNGLLFY